MLCWLKGHRANDPFKLADHDYLEQCKNCGKVRQFYIDINGRHNKKWRK